MARRPTGAAPLTFALQAQLLAAGDPCRDLRGDLAFLGDASRAAAGVTRLGDDAATAPTLRAGACDGKESLLEADLSLTAALRAHGRRGSRRRTRAAARLAALLPRNLNRRFG